jgi:ABC-2 type transport system ATP-binding protein
MNVIETNSLSKQYISVFSKQTVNALNDFTFSVQQGEIFGLLGPNGAGKTTLIKILLGITFPTKGQAKLFGKEIKDYTARKKVGYLPENHRFPGYLTGEQVLRYYGELSGLKNDSRMKENVDWYLSVMNLGQWRKTKVRKYSKGMLQKLGIAQALLSDPELIFLDEPTDGVDPIGRKEIRDILLELRAKGMTIFLNSHLLSEVEMICDRVAILNKGDMVLNGSVDVITKTDNVYEIQTDSSLTMELKSKILEIDPDAGAGENEIHTSKGITGLNSIIDLLRASNINIISVKQKTSTLEDLFINVIRKKIPDVSNN